MDESLSNESLYAHIQQLEQERDELQKDIEQLCMQQAGPSYITLATQMHFRRTAGLEQEIENLKKKLASWSKENSNLKEELSESKRIKTYIDQLHKLEVTKNTEAAKQLEYLRGVVADAFADRDHAIMEAEKAKENEDLMSQKLNDAERRLQELTVGSIETQEQLTNLQIKLAKQEQEIEIFRKIIDKFYKIRQHACSGTKDEESGWDNLSEDIGWDDKCACLNNDTPEAWSFNVREEASNASYVALQEELDTLKGTVDDLQSKLQMGMEIEKHLKKKVRILVQKKIRSDRLIIDKIASLHECYSQLRIHIIDLLDDGKSYLQSAIASIEEKVISLSKDTGSDVAAKVNDTSMPNISQAVDFSEDLTRALQEKVSALLLLSQEEERHVLETNVHAVVQETLDELQRNLEQATAEKVKALMELAVLKQENQRLQERTNPERRQRNLLPNSDDRRIIAPERDGRLSSFLKKTSFKHWLGTEANPPSVAHSQSNYEESLTYGSSNSSLNDARLQFENATLKDSMNGLEHLTASIRKLRHSLIQANEMSASKDTSCTSRWLNEIIREAELMKTALGSSLPVSWSGEGDMASSSDVIFDKDSNFEKIDVVSSAVFEMVELLILAGDIMKEKVPKRESKSENLVRQRHSKNKMN